MKILLAAPNGRATDALCGLLRKLGPGHAIEIIPDPQFLPASDAALAEFLFLDIDAVADAPAMVAAALHRHPRSRIVAIGTPLAQSPNKI